jgi:hypothetical protein
MDGRPWRPWPADGLWTAALTAGHGRQAMASMACRRLMDDSFGAKGVGSFGAKGVGSFGAKAVGIKMRKFVELKKN